MRIATCSQCPKKIEKFATVLATREKPQESSPEKCISRARSPPRIREETGYLDSPNLSIVITALRWPSAEARCILTAMRIFVPSAARSNFRGSAREANRNRTVKAATPLSRSFPPVATPLSKRTYLSQGHPRPRTALTFTYLPDGESAALAYFLILRVSRGRAASERNFRGEGDASPRIPRVSSPGLL